MRGANIMIMVSVLYLISASRQWNGKLLVCYSFSITVHSSDKHLLHHSKNTVGVLLATAHEQSNDLEFLPADECHAQGHSVAYFGGIFSQIYRLMNIDGELLLPASF